MRYRVSVMGIVGIAGLLMGDSLLACGDKFLVAGRGARFQRGSAHATVLIYAPPSSTLSGGEDRLGIFDMSTKLKLMGVEVASIGDAHATQPGARVVAFTDAVSGIYKKLVLKDNKLVGAMLLGDIREGRAAEELVAQGRDMSDVKDRIFAEGFDLRSLVGK